VSVDTTFPVSNGAVQWTPLANSNWQEVSEIAMDSDTSYNFSSTPGQTDLFNMGALRAATSVVLGVQVTGAYRKDDATARQVAQQIKSGATQSAGTTNSIPSGYAYYTDLFVLDPNTAASWTVTAAGSAEIGYNLVA